MFEDGYTISQAAKVLDIPDDALLETIKEGSIKTFRKYGLFGPVLIDKAFIDDIAPSVRSITSGSRQAYAEHIKYMEQSAKELEEGEKKLEAIRIARETQERDFLVQLAKIIEERQK